MSESYFVILSCVLWMRKGHTPSFLSTYRPTYLISNIKASLFFYVVIRFHD